MNEKKKRRVPAYLRKRKRYIVYQVWPAGNPTPGFNDVDRAIRSSVRSFLGDHGAAQAGVWVMKDRYDPATGQGLVRCVHERVEQVRAALALVTMIGNARVRIDTLGVSGSISTAKRKFTGDENGTNDT